MKKFCLIILSISLISHFTLGQTQRDILEKNFIVVIAERAKGKFTIKTKDGRDLLYGGTPGTTPFTSQANFKIGNIVYTQNEFISYFSDPRPISLPSFNYFYDTNKIVYRYQNVDGIEITQELIPKENIAKRAGAILIKYTFRNIGAPTTPVGAVLKLDTKIGENDQARIAKQGGFIQTVQYIGQGAANVPDFWLAFENSNDTNALVGRGTLRGKDLIVPDFLFVGDYNSNQLAFYKYNDPLAEGGQYYDSEILMQWNQVNLEPGKSVSFSTLYGMAEIDYQGKNLQLTCNVPYDTLTVNQQSNYEINPFDYLVTVRNPGDVEKNLKIQLKLDNDVFYLQPASDSVKNDVITGGEQKLYTWKIYTKNQYNGRDHNIRVEVYSDGSSTTDDFCSTKVFVPANRAKLTTSVNPPGTGKIQVQPLGSISDKGDTLYIIGTNVTLTASSTDPCWEFEKWSGDYTGTNNQATITMDRSKNVVANFKKKQYALMVTIQPLNAGTVTKNPSKTQYDCGEKVTLTASSNYGYKFLEWDGDLKGTVNPATITMDANKAVIAKFEPDSFTLVVNINPANLGKVNVNKEALNIDVKTSQNIKLKNGDEVTLAATPIDYCYKFRNWGADTSGTDSIIKVKMWRDKTITAYFDVRVFKLNVSTDNNGSVSIQPLKSNNEYYCGDTVTITASPNHCYSFDKWHYKIGPYEGDTTKNPVTFQMLADITGTAYFKIINYKLITSIYPVGSGRVNGKISDTSSYNCDANVTLTAIPEPCYNFLHWSDSVSNTNPIRQVRMTSDKNIQAVFKIKKFSITSQTDYSNGGIITRNPDSSSYDCGRRVNVSINPAKCFSFVKWSGDASGNQLTTTLTLDTNKSIIAKMAQIIFNFSKAEHNIFPNIVLDFKIDSIPFNAQSYPISPLTKSMLIISDSSKKDNSRTISDYTLRTSNNQFKVIYMLPGKCYDSPDDTLRYASILFNRGNCIDRQTKSYTIPLYAGCDSCSRALRRKDTSKVYLSKLYINHPNPFNPETRIRYSISNPGKVWLAVYDMLGREITRLVNEYQEPGEYEIRFIPSGLPSGVYFYRIQAGNFTDIKKMLYVK